MLLRLAPAAVLLGLTAALIALPTPAAQFGATPKEDAAADGITVTAEGRATVEADRVVVQLRTRARAKTVKQALEEFRASRTLLDKALADFDDIGLEWSSGGVRIGLKSQDPNAFVMNDEPTKPPFEAMEITSASFPAGDGALESVAEVLVAANDAGTDLNADSGMNPYVFWGAQQTGQKPDPPVGFYATDETMRTARDAAMQAAFADALEQAQTLAKIAGRRVDKMESIRVLSPFPTVSPNSDTSEGRVRIAVRFSLLQE